MKNNDDNGPIGFESLNYDQARQFWFAAMQSKRAEAMAAFMGLPVSDLASLFSPMISDTKHGRAYRDHVIAQHKRVASFFLVMSEIFAGIKT